MSEVLRKLWPFCHKESSKEANVLNELVGHRCRVVFDLPANQWPFPGYPAWCYVLAVDGPMIKLGYSMSGGGKWVTQRCIMTIEL